VSRRTLINDRFELEEMPIARGGMGEVWFGRDIKLDREVAVKLVRFPSGVPDPDFVKRFVRESRVMARLAHPGVPAVYDAGTHEKRPYLVMQRIHGASLKDLVAENGPLPIGWAAGIAAQICSVLAAAHEASLVHRDLKPSNVMLDTEGAVKVIDFGLATGPSLADLSKITHSGEPIGTPAYMAPEQVLAAISTPQTDLYALGCTLHETLTGRPVFHGTTSYSLMNQQVSETPRSLRSVRPDVPAELERLVLELLEKKPEDRPASAEAVYHRLLPFVSGLGPLPGVVNPASKTSPARMYARALSRVLADTAPTSPPPTAPRRAERRAAPPKLGRTDLTRIREEAAALAKQSRFSQAAEVLASGVHTARQALGDTDKDVIALRLELADLRFEGGDYRAAAPDYVSLARDIAGRDGAENELVLQCRLKEATCHALLGETGLALRQLNDLLADESRIFGDDDPRTIELRRQLALLHIGAGERDAARAALQRLAADLTRLHGPSHDSVAEVNNLLGQLDRRGTR
jgi:hypothetical protein